MPTMHPVEIWETSGRDKTFDVLFRFKNGDQDVVLGPTHEEVITTLMKEIKSYRNLPQMAYQIQTKFRNEARPKAGLLRVREFTMKDSYSFDIDQAGLDASFDAHYAAYTRIYARLGLDAVPVIASSGAMGGTGSVEFVAASDSGEDDIVRCPNDDYAANAERASSVLDVVTDDAGPGASPERFDTPGVHTIAELSGLRWRRSGRPTNQNLGLRCRRRKSPCFLCAAITR